MILDNISLEFREYIVSVWEMKILWNYGRIAKQQNIVLGDVGIIIGINWNNLFEIADGGESSRNDFRKLEYSERILPYRNRYWER